MIHQKIFPNRAKVRALAGAATNQERLTQTACGGSVLVSTPGSIPVSVKEEAFAGQAILLFGKAAADEPADHSFPVGQLLSGIAVATRRDRDPVNGNLCPPTQIGARVEHAGIVSIRSYDRGRLRLLRLADRCCSREPEPIYEIYRFLLCQEIAGLRFRSRRKPAMRRPTD